MIRIASISSNKIEQEHRVRPLFRYAPQGLLMLSVMKKRNRQLLIVLAILAILVVGIGLLWQNHKRNLGIRFERSYELVRNTLSTNPSYCVYEDGYEGLANTQNQLIIELQKGTVEDVPEWIENSKSIISRLPRRLQTSIWATSITERAILISVYDDPNDDEINQLVASLEPLDVHRDFDVRIRKCGQYQNHNE